MNVLTQLDWILTPIYMVIILAIGYLIQSSNQKKYPEYRYFTAGLFAKLIGAIAFALVYALYYKGGDTVNYFQGSIAVSKLLLQNPEAGWNVINNNLGFIEWSSFNNETGWPPHYMWRDPYTFTVCRYSAILAYLSLNSFMVMSLLTACISFVGIWKLYRLFNDLYPNNDKLLAYSILYIPTLIFWGSGIMKDTYVLGATCWITSNFYYLFIARKKVLSNVIFLLINMLVIINIKPYILLSLLPGVLLWLNSAYLQQLSNTFLRVLMLPIITILLIGGGLLVFSNLSGLMGKYADVDQAIEQAQVIQQDLLREEQYGGNSYYIGEIDGTVGGMIRLAPIAIFTALYRPLFWEVGSPMMVISVLENTILLVVTLFLLFKVKWGTMVKLIYKEPILLYSLVFSLLFAFGVGVAGTNFGALVRYKTPLVPFYFSMLFLIYSMSKTVDTK